MKFSCFLWKEILVKKFKTTIWTHIHYWNTHKKVYTSGNWFNDAYEWLTTLYIVMCVCVWEIEIERETCPHLKINIFLDFSIGLWTVFFLFMFAFKWLFTTSVWYIVSYFCSSLKLFKICNIQLCPLSWRMNEKKKKKKKRKEKKKTLKWSL